MSAPTLAQAPTAHGRVYSGLKTALMKGEFLPGERLVVRVLAERFKTSPMPVREALHRLVSEEALVDHANRGVIVPEVDGAVIADIVRIRSTIEGAATEWAASTIGDTELAHLEEINRKMQACAESGNSSDFLSLNRDFHFSIYRAAGSPLMLPIIERLWLRAGPWLNLIREGATIGLDLNHHAEMLDALRRDDGSRARRAVVADIGDAADVILRSIAVRGSASAPPRRRTADGTHATRRLVPS